MDFRRPYRAGPGRLSRLNLSQTMLSVTAFILVAAVSAVSPAAAQNSVSNTLVVGRVSSDPVKTLPRLQYLADYLAANLIGYGINGGTAVVARNNAEMADLLRQGRVHILSETAMSALWFAENGAAQPILREWKGGVSTYRSILLTRQDAPLQSIEDLPGKTIAFEDPGSTTGFLLPLAMIRAAGIPVRQIDRSEHPAPDEVGYFFTDSEIGVAAIIERGIADAGAMSDLEWQRIQSHVTLRENLHVFAQSDPVTRSLLLAGPAVSDDLRRQITNILTGAEDDEAATNALQQYYKVTRYDVLIGAAERNLDVARDLFPLVSGSM